MIRVEGLRKNFGSVLAVRGVDLQVEAGQLLVLLGQNGAGKSTTLRCLGGLLRPDAGTVRFGDLRLPVDVDAIRASLGVVPDLARLYGRTTATEYLEHFAHLYGLPPAVSRGHIQELLGRFDLADRQDQVLASYSKGMAQKVALIRATVHRPRWIFCDEPTAGLDPVAAADMRRYLREQADRGAALIVTTHLLSEAEQMADRIVIMRRGEVVARGTLAELRRRAHGGRRFVASLSSEGAGTGARDVLGWLRERCQDPVMEGDRLEYGVPWEWSQSELASFAAELQSQLDRSGLGYYELREADQSLESVYLSLMSAPATPPPSRGRSPEGSEGGNPEAATSGLRPSVLLASLRRQPQHLAVFLPFYLSSWWRRGDLSWVMYLNGFVFLLIASISLFGAMPSPMAQVLARVGGTSTLQAGLLLPLFFMSFALLESIKSSIGIWWEKAQQSLEVLLYTPLEDPALIWLEVLPGVIVSAAYVTVWIAAGMGVMELVGRGAPWDLLPVFTLVAGITAYWAAMGRMLGFMLFPREGAAGGAWSFLLSPVSAAIADLPLALFVFRSPVAPAGLLLPFAACLALTLLCASSFDRERLLETGAQRTSRSRVGWGRLAVVQRHGAALAAGLLLAGVPAAGAAVAASAVGAHSWSDVRVAMSGARVAPDVGDRMVARPVVGQERSGVMLAAAVMGGVVGFVSVVLLLLIASFAAFFLLGVPQLVLLPLVAVAWGTQAAFGPQAPLAAWLTLGGGVALLAMSLNTAASLPVYGALVFGSGRRLDRLRMAWSDYFAIFRLLVLPACILFGGTITWLLLTA